MRARFQWLTQHLEEVLCAVIFAVMAVVAFANVVTRYLFRYSLAFTEELEVSLFVWLTLLGTAVAFRDGSHLGFRFFVERLPKRAQHFLVWVSAVLSSVLFVLLGIFAIHQIQDEISLGITSSGIGIPQWWYTAGVPVWSLVVIARIIQGAWRTGRARGSN
jgi:TRAP-type C4-dicarboxylate transport system permease small subunit